MCRSVLCEKALLNIDGVPLKMESRWFSESLAGIVVIFLQLLYTLLQFLLLAYHCISYVYYVGQYFLVKHAQLSNGVGFDSLVYTYLLRSDLDTLIFCVKL